MRLPIRALRSWDPATIDIVFALTVLAELETQWWMAGSISTKDRAVTAVASLLFVIPLALRRRMGPAALIVAAAVLAVEVPFGGALLSGSINGQVAPLVVIATLSYSTGAWLAIRSGALSVAVGLTFVCVAGFLPGNVSVPTGWAPISWSLFYSTLSVLPGYFTGRLVWRYTQRSTAFRNLAERSNLERAIRETAAIEDERTRIGRELEDVIAHSVSAMVVQAGGARMLLDSDAERARRSIENVERTGRETLGDLRRLLGMLHKGDDPRALSPQPGLRQAESLMVEMAQGGLDCKLRTEGDPISLSPGVDLVAYRVVEAVLTAVAPTAHHAAVNQRYTHSGLELEITGDVAPIVLEEDLEPIRQRLTLYDGSLTVLSSANQSFAVHATLPFPAAFG